MKILVTGSSGRIGQYVVRDLTAAGHEVTGIDRVTPQDAPGNQFQVDLKVSGEIYQALARSRCESVIHLGAWSNAGIASETRTYGDNTQSTFNLFQACADLGIKRVISASSAQVYGLAKESPVYLPVDESHPLRPANCYALSKVVGEETANFFVKNYGMTILSFRFMGVRTPDEFKKEIDKAVHNPSDFHLLWTRTDVRDAAMACRLAIEVEEVLPGPYNITGSRIVLDTPTLKLVKHYFGEEMKVRGNLPDFTSPMSCCRAQSAFGYKNKYFWSFSQNNPEPSEKKL